MFATIKQKWDAFKNNWSEYLRLRANVTAARGEVEKAREKLVARSGKDNKKTGCIDSSFISVPRWLGGDRSCLSKYQVTVSEYYCPYFNGDKYLTDVELCSQTGCPFHEKNSEYVAAVRKLKIASDKIDKFLYVGPRMKSK